MLKTIFLKNFVIISELSLDFSPGFTVITGETGAGKSIALEALAIVLGDRSDGLIIRAGSERCEIGALFEIDPAKLAGQWLKEQDLAEENECMIRRVIGRDGRSRATINGRPVTLQQVRELGSLLVHIHGQHGHTLLLKSGYQRQLLDSFAQHLSLCVEVSDCYEQWRQAQQALSELLEAEQARSAQHELLQFQCQEMLDMALQPEEWSQLEREQKQLAHAEHWLTSSQQILACLAENEPYNLLNGLHTVKQQLKDMITRGADLHGVAEMIEQSSVQISEATAEIRRYLDTLELDPKRLQWVDERLGMLNHLARKHKIEPELLLHRQQALQEQLMFYDDQSKHLEELKAIVHHQAQRYQSLAEQLTESRRQAALRLSQVITEQIRRFAMSHAEFSIRLTPRIPGEIHPHGAEQIEFLLTANPGQPPQPLAKAASGGELSRAALAIQLATVRQETLPTVIFDEVDVGIGGGTAEIVGQELKKLSEHTQVLCVTHQPQVAAQGNVHVRVKKWVKEGETITELEQLGFHARLEELARMLGGVHITEVTLTHAKEMLEQNKFIFD